MSEEVSGPPNDTGKANSCHEPELDLKNIPCSTPLLPQLRRDGVRGSQGKRGDCRQEAA